MIRLSAKAQYLTWRRGAAVGCVFARLVAIRPADYDQKIEVLASAGTAKRVAGSIAKRIDRLVADDVASAGVLLLPGLTSLQKLTEVALALRTRLHWSVETTRLQRPPNVDLVAIHLVREIPFGEAPCPSEVLVFGPFPEFPPTRRAPVPALEIYVGEPRPYDPKTGAPTTKANLAHMGVNLLNQNAFDIMWEKSIEGRRASLGGDDNRAKAKVSFVIPLALAEQLGCAP